MKNIIFDILGNKYKVGNTVYKFSSYVKVSDDNYICVYESKKALLIFYGLSSTIIDRKDISIWMARYKNRLKNERMIDDM